MITLLILGVIIAIHFQLSTINYFNHLRLMMPETYLIAHKFILHRVLQWGIEQHLHFFAFDESHLDDSFAESTMS